MRWESRSRSKGNFLRRGQDTARGGLPPAGSDQGTTWSGLEIQVGSEKCCLNSSTAERYELRARSVSKNSLSAGTAECHGCPLIRILITEHFISSVAAIPLGRVAAIAGCAPSLRRVRGGGSSLSQELPPLLQQGLQLLPLRLGADGELPGDLVFSPPCASRSGPPVGKARRHASCVMVRYNLYWHNG